MELFIGMFYRDSLLGGDTGGVIYPAVAADVEDAVVKITDIDIKPKRSKLENMMVKAQVLQILHQIGVDDADALKTVNLFSDVTSVYAASKDRMQRQFDYSVGQGTVEELPDVNANASTDRIIAS